MPLISNLPNNSTNLRPTIPYIEAKFREYNELIFDGSLPPIPFRLTNARSFLGKISYRKESLPDGRKKFSNFIFHISARLDRPEEVIEDTILHEMIHYRILSRQEQDTAPHGELFRAWMNHINTKYGRHITIRHRSTEEEHNSDYEIHQHFICVLLMSDGSTGIAVSAKTRIFKLWDAFDKAPSVARAEWCTSMNTYFNRFPRTQTPKFFRLDSATIRRELEDSYTLIRQPGIIRVGSTPPDLSFLP